MPLLQPWPMAMNGYDIEECAKMGIASSILALIHEDTINPNMSIENIKNYMKEVKNVKKVLGYKRGSSKGLR